MPKRQDFGLPLWPKPESSIILLPGWVESQMTATAPKLNQYNGLGERSVDRSICGIQIKWMNDFAAIVAHILIWRNKPWRNLNWVIYCSDIAKGIIWTRWHTSILNWAFHSGLRKVIKKIVIALWDKDCNAGKSMNEREEPCGAVVARSTRIVKFPIDKKPRDSATITLILAPSFPGPVQVAMYVSVRCLRPHGAVYDVDLISWVGCSMATMLSAATCTERARDINRYQWRRTAQAIYVRAK